MKHALGAALILPLLLNVTGAQEVVLPTEGLEISVMTFNIRYGTADDGENRWELRKGMVVDLIRNEAPDVIGVQEALRFQLDEIRDALSVYHEVGAGRDDGATAGEYSAVLYRSDRFRSLENETFWFSDTPEIPGSKSWGNFIPRICTSVRLQEKSSGRSFFVYNVHLDHSSQPSRERSVTALMRKMYSRLHGESVVVTGDFNAGEQNPAIRFLKHEAADSAGEHARLTLLDTYRVVHPSDALVGTFHAFEGARTGDKIDYIFVEPRTVVIDAAILYKNVDGRYPSDHFPVTARIAFPSGANAK